jgi:hypothetical protein
MSQRMLRRIVTAGALAALLALFMPAQAEARELGGWGGMLRWLNGFWESGASALCPSAPAGEGGVADRRPTTKQGFGIDPNGKPIPDPATPSGTPCGATCDQGYGIDPNG